MQWERWKADGDTIWGIEHTTEAPNAGCKYEIRVVGEDSGGNPTRWGVWVLGKPLLGKVSARTGHAAQITFDRVGVAKAFVERTIVKEL